MAKKYWWEDDESQTTTQNQTQSKNTQQGTSKKYWWEDDSQQNDTQNNQSKSYWWDDGSVANTVGKNIYDRVSTWLENHNNYISNYQNRYSGRKGNLEDKYVNDSEGWLRVISKQKENFDAEADSILSYMDQYSGYLDADWMEQVRSTLTSARGNQKSVLDYATKDNEYWNSFGSDELVSQYGSGKGVYEYYQRGEGYRKKYEGLSAEDLKWASSFLEDGEEKDWLASYTASVDYNEKSKYDVASGEAEIAALEQEILDLDDYLADSHEVLMDYYGTDYDKKAAELFKDFGGTGSGVIAAIEEKQKQIEEKKKYLADAQKVQELNVWNSVTNNADFAQNSEYVSTVKYHRIGSPTLNDKTYEYVNNPTLSDGRTARDLILQEDRAYKRDTPLRNTDSSYEKEALEYMKEEEVAIYNYYYATQGPEKAQQYLDLLVDTFQARKNADTYEKTSKFANEHPWISSALSVVTSIGSGFEYIGDVIDYGGDKLFGKDTTMDTNSLALQTNAIRGTVSDKVDWEIGNWDAFDFLYSTTMSGIDSVASTAFGGASGVVLGLSAAAQGTNDALTRGMSSGQAFWNGLFTGAFEMVFESVSIGNFNMLKEVPPKTVKDIFKNLGKSMLVNASEETATEIANIAYDTLINGEFANYTLEELANGAWKDALAQVLEAGASGALMGVGMGAVAQTSGYVSNKRADNAALKQYGDKADALIQEGLASDIKSESYKLAQEYKKQTEEGKALTGEQIRSLLSANKEQIAPKVRQVIKQLTVDRLTELGQTEDVSKVAELATKYATGQNLSNLEKSVLARSQYGAQVAKEMTTRAYDESTKAEPSTYKPLTERTDKVYAKSETGKATVNGKEVSLDNATVAKISEDGMVLRVDGEEVSTDKIEFADSSQSYLYSAVSKIENITPGAATAIIQGYNASSGQTVGEYLNGIDEAYTYGYHGYYEADLKAGQFTNKLTDKQVKEAYKMGQYVKEARGASKAEAIKKMRTAMEAETAKAVAEGKEAPSPKKMTITYNEGNGKVVDFDKASVGGRLTTKQKAAPVLAQVMHEMGLGTNFELFSSYVNKDGIRVFLDENGVEQKAYSGVYRKSDGTIRIDLNAYNGKKLTLDAMSHELTHFIQQWSTDKYEVLADFLVKTYEKTDMTMHERVLREQARLKGVRGKEVSYSEAYDEVVANAMSKMLSDSKVMEKLTELKEKDADLAHKLWEGLKKLLNKFFRVYEKESALFYDAADLMEMKTEFEQMKQMWAEAFVEASENFQASLTVAESQTLTEAGIGFDVDTKSVYSLHFSNAYTEQIQVGKKTFDADAISKLVSEVTGRSITDAQKWVQSEMTIANIVMQNPEFLDFEADNRYEAIKKNSDYPQGTVDLSNLCPKREEFTTMFDMLQKKYPNKLFTAQDVADMRKILSDNDITVACGACFVEDRRQLIGEIADTFIGMWKEAVDSGKPLQKTNAAGSKVELQVTKALAKQYGLTAGTNIMATDTYIPNQYDLTTYEGFKKLEKNHPTIAMAFNRYNNSRGQQSARLIEGRAEYKRQILGWSDAKVRTVNNNGGLRIFSFSDFEVVHLLDLVQVIIDCAAKGVKIQGYTKIPAFAKLVRNTGVKLNRSLIPSGDYGYHMENGKVVLDYDTTEGININDENFMDESDNPNVGNIVIGINPTQIGAAMLDPFIDYIIPFHSNKAKEILRKLGTGEWVNYKESQHEKDIATGTSSKHNVNIYTEVINKYHPTNKVEFVEAFLKECKRQGKIPRYAEFLNVDANGDYAYREGYHKLLVDFKMFDAEGNILPQGNITPNLDESFMKDLLNAEIDKKQNYEFPQAVYDAIDKKFGEQQSSQETDLDTNKDSAYDSAKKKTEQEDKANGRREETREDFHRRAVQEGCTVNDRGKTAYAFRPIADWNLAESIRIAERNLREKGIPVIVCDLFEVNRDGITTPRTDAIADAGEAVYLLTSMDADPIEVAEHEAYHFWKHTQARMDYFAELYKNFNFDSPAAIDLLSRIEKAYIESPKVNVETDVEVESDESVKLIEEAFAFVTGFTASGDQRGIAHKILRDFDAVKAAWDDLIKKQTAGKSELYSTQETDNISNRDLLANAFEGIVQNSNEYKLIEEYKGRIKILNEYEAKLDKLNAEIREIRFGTTGPRDMARLQQLEAEAKNVAQSINRQDKKLLSLEASEPLRKVIERERKKEAKKTVERVKEIQQNKKIRAEQTEYRYKIRNFKKKLEGKLLRPTDRQYVPVDLIKAMVEVCEIIDTDTDLYKADGSINKAQVKRDETKEKLSNLKDAYENLQNHSDPIYAGEFDDVVYDYLKELRVKFSDKSLKEMSLDELSEMYEILVAIDETLADARKLIGWGDAESVYEAGDAIVEEQLDIMHKRKHGKRNDAQKGLDKIDNLGLSPVRNVERMSGYNQDSSLLRLFKKFEQGVRKKNKFKMDAYKIFEELTSGKEYDDAVYKEVEGKKYTDVKGREFGVSKMQMMQAILSLEREKANKNLHHIENGGFTFADLKMLRNGKLKEAVSAENSHRVAEATGMVLEFQEAIKDDKWCQDYMTAARNFFNGMAKDVINETSIALKHRIIAKDKNYIPFEVDTNFVNTEITDMDAVQKTINAYGMLKETVDNAPQSIYITGLNNILDRHIEQVSTIHGLAIEVRNFNKVWNVRYKDASNNSPTVKESIDTNWGKDGVKHIEQAVKDIQGPRVRERNALYDKVKSGYIGSTFLLNLSVVTKQIGSLFSATSLLKWRDPARMIGNLLYTMANHKKISAEVDKYTATAWMRRQGMSDAELYTLMTQAKKPGLLHKLDKAPAIINPTKWITAMDHAVALSLWRYAKQDTAKKTGFKGEELLKATAEFYDELVENTQSMTDVLHRPEIQKRGDIISESFAMFKTDLYQMAGQLQATTGRYMANKSKENGAALGRTVYSIAMSAIWGQLMTTVFALLRYKVDRYRDDDDEEEKLTVESWLKRQGFGLVGDMMGYIFPIFGSEVVGVFENIMYGEADDVVDSIALTAINDLYSAMITIGTSIKDGEMPDASKMRKFAAKVLQVFGIPANNIIRTLDAIQLHAEDIANGEFFSFNAGVDSKTDDLYDAIVSGNKTVHAKLKATYVDKHGNFDQSKYENAVVKALKDNDPRIKDAAQARYDGNTEEYKRIFREIQAAGKFGFDDIMSAINSAESAIKNKLEPDKVTSSYSASDFVQAVIMGDTETASAARDDIINTHVANGKTQEEAKDAFVSSVKSSTHDAYSSGLLDEAGAENMLMEYADMDEDESASRVNYWAFCDENPEYANDISESKYNKYTEFAEPANISLDLFVQYIKGTKGLETIKDEWGDVDVSKREQVLEVIDSLPLTWQQKDALYLAHGYAESKIWDVPW